MGSLNKRLSIFILRTNPDSVEAIFRISQKAHIASLFIRKLSHQSFSTPMWYHLFCYFTAILLAHQKSIHKIDGPLETMDTFRINLNKYLIL